MKRYILKPLEEIQTNISYRRSINMKWREGVVELSVMNMILTDENRTESTIDYLDVTFTLMSPNNCPIPDTFLIQVSNDYMPARPLWKKCNHYLEETLIDDLGLDYQDLEKYYTTILGDVYSDDTNYNVEMERMGTAGVIIFYDLLGRNIAQYRNLGGDVDGFQWDKDFLKRVKPSIIKAQTTHTEAKFENFLEIWE